MKDPMKRNYGWSSIIVIMFITISFSGCLNSNDETIKDAKGDPFIFKINDTTINIDFRMGEERFEVYNGRSWNEMIVRGVNLGMGKPGYFPGEAAITEDEYSRWIRQIGDMNANVIRVYTHHPPEFYRSLYEYNVNSDEPIYLLQGTWIDEEAFFECNTVFDETVTGPFMKDLESTVDIIHGNAIIEQKPGQPFGDYSTDISRYTLGYLIGIEWEPTIVNGTNSVEREINDFDGDFLKTIDASPFEIWLARMLDHLIGYEVSSYREQRPVSFVNWVTTDKLDHPSEPVYYEDMVSIDPEHIKMKDEHYPGDFATYHVYPYYPDFLNYDPTYTSYIDRKGNLNSFAGYLNDLKRHHDGPVLIGEFGLPSSRGITHRSIMGWNQGGLSEKEQGMSISYMYGNILDEDYAGGIVFSWQDEWFKRTWNTRIQSDPGRRPYWSDAQTCEQHFGLLSFDPGEYRKITIDGRRDDWDSLPLQIISNRGVSSGNDGKLVDSILATSDEGYLYIALKLENSDINWDNTEIDLFIDTIPENGIRKPNGSDIRFANGMEFILHIAGPDNTRLLVDSHYDQFYHEYGFVQGRMELLKYPSEPDNGIFHPIRMALNYELDIPSTNITLPFEYHETGKMIWGVSDPESPNFNSVSDIYGPGKERLIEIRIPWLLLGARDPSRKIFMNDLWGGGAANSVKIDTIGIAGCSIFRDKGGNVSYDTYPEMNHGEVPSEGMLRYHLREWDIPTYHERLKMSYYYIKQMFFETKEME
jgi:hypothetical protein